MTNSVRPSGEKQAPASSVCWRSNASGTNDGAPMMLVTCAAKAEELGLPVNGRLVSAAVSGVDPAYMGIGMVPASLKALGHPIGATGAVLTVKALYELERRQARYGLVTLCIGGGMGIAAVFERVG